MQPEACANPASTRNGVSSIELTVYDGPHDRSLRGAGEARRGRHGRRVESPGHAARPFVALKVLPAEKVADPERKRRFVQEAKAASALNHPNIVTIHDIAHEDGADFIVMEYVRGSTLDQLIHRKGLRTAETLKYAIQIADALAAAHAAGIVHRDLKPGNIMVSEDGLVKVVDFGLAKLTEAIETSEDAATRAMGPSTEDGAIIGTVSYMSPEQAEGKKVDARSDIFSFGAVMYEMVTGRRAFQGDSKMSTLAAVIGKDPKPVREIAEGSPRELERLILHCLRKDPARRFQHMEDIKTLLEGLKEESDSGSLATTSPAAPVRSWGRLYGVAAALILCGIGAAIAFWLGTSRPAASRVPQSKLTRLTSDSGLTYQPAISADGKLVAYASDRAGEDNLDIWLRQVAGGEPARLTSDPADDYEPDFSPDGSRIAFRSDRDGGGIYIVSTLGGEARLIVRQGFRPKFSPDGRLILYSLGATRGSNNVRTAHLVPAAGGPSKQWQADFGSISSPVWSPDGKHILFAGRREFAGRYERTEWWVAPVERGSVVQTGAVESLLGNGFVFTDTSGSVLDQWSSARDAVIFSGQAGDSTNLWEISLAPGTWKATGAPRRLTIGTGPDIEPTVAATGQLAFASVNRNVDIWSLPVDANNGQVKGTLVRLTADAAADRSPSLSADGNTLVFDSDRAGNFHIWRKDLRTGKETALTVTSSTETSPVISPDGDQVAYTCVQDRKSGICTLSLRDGTADRIFENDGVASDWSPDGRSVLCRWASAGTVGLLETVSRKTVLLLQNERHAPFNSRISPDGRWIAFNISGPITQVIAAPARPRLAAAGERVDRRNGRNEHRSRSRLVAQRKPAVLHLGS